MAKKEVSNAAEKVAAAEKKKDKKPANPNGNFFVRAAKAIKKFCKDLKGEVKKIVWPDAKTVLKSTLVVLAAVAVCGIAIGVVDWLLSQGLSLLEMAAAKVGGAADAVATATDSVIDHGDHMVGALNGSQGSIYRGTERYIAVLVGARHLNHSHITGHSTRTIELLCLA